MPVSTASRNGHLAAVLGLVLAAGPVLAEEAAVPADPALMTHGERLYSADCAACHQISGTGVEPAFPALAGNARLSDAGLIVSNVHDGRGAMPSFPQFDDNDLAAVATYIRNSWGNDFGGVAVDEVAPLLADRPAEAAGEVISIWDGVYTEAQADRGDPILMGACAKCHGTRLNGAGDPDQEPSPPIARVGFLGKWSGDSVQSLAVYTLSQMPLDNPGQLDEQQVVDAIARMLQVSGAPAGDTELSPDLSLLANIIISPPED